MKPNKTVCQFHIRRSLLIFDAPAFLSILLPWKYLYLQGIHMSDCRQGCLSAELSPVKECLFQAGVRFRNIRHFHLVISSDARHSGRKTAGFVVLSHKGGAEERQTTFTITILRLQNINLSLFVSNPHNFFFTETERVLSEWQPQFL